MTKDEALKLALEALEHEADKGNDDAYKLERDAIKEALAQPEQEPVAMVESVATVVSESGNQEVTMSWWHEPALPVGTKLYTTPPQRKPEQEPVAWRALVSKFPQGTGSDWVYVTKPIMKDSVHNQPLYTTPPQRTWVGLTLDERIELAKDVDWAIGAYCEYAEKIEAKLKEKNT